MHYIVWAKDGTGEDIAERRNTAEQDHITYSNFAAESGEQVLGVDILNQEQKMNGSVMVVEFDSIERVKEWLDNEPYVTNGVWQDIQIFPCQIGPSFEHLIKKNRTVN